MTIDINELRRLMQDFKLAGSPMLVQTAQMSELLDRLEAAEKSDAESIAMYRKARDERDALRTKIEQMEKQEPVGTLHDDGYFVWRKTAPYESNYGGWKMALYALPGAQPAPSVPTGFVWPECPKRRQSHVLFDDGYEEGWAVCVATIKAVLAAAPEAKP